ncbi:MAG: DNA mismatch repair protein MutS [Burkholderiales bacterium]|nr:MAG: DNA mismatch repair protein MutS [Burkholderiales bacterium]
MTRSPGRPSSRRPGRPASLESFDALGRHLQAEVQARAREEAEGERIERERRRLERERLREANLFRDTVGGVVPLRPTGRIDPQRREIPATAMQRERDERAALAASLSDEIGIEQHLETDDALSFRRASVGPDVVRRLRRGEWAVRGQIDLHGLRVAEAREALAAFLDEALRREWRCVRVIHGKGLGSIGREPVLKAKVPRWLVQRREVLAFCQARPNDGGAGAVIVLLQ